MALPAIAGTSPRSSCPTTPPVGFRKVTTPDFGSGEPAAVSSYLVAARGNNLALATNGTTIMATDDFGCHWRRSFTTARPSPAGGESPAGGVNGLLGLGGGAVAAVVDSVEITVTGGLPAPSLDSLSPAIAVSTDGAHSWVFLGTVPPTVRRLISVTTPHVDTERVQLYAIGVDAGSQSVVLASSDAGRHWVVTNDAGAPGRGQDITTIAAGPKRGQVWVAGHGLSESTDGGTTFAPVAGAPSGISGITATGSEVAVVAEFGLYQRSKTGTWKRLTHTENGTVTAAVYDGGGRLWATATRPSGGALSEVDSAGAVLETLGPLAGQTLDDVQATSQPDIVAVRSIRDGKDYGLGVFNGIGLRAHQHDEVGG